MCFLKCEASIKLYINLKGNSRILTICAIVGFNTKQAFNIDKNSGSYLEKEYVIDFYPRKTSKLIGQIFSSCNR